MLASLGRPEDIPRLERDGWLFDLKVDGCRCVAEVEDGRVTLTSRSGANMTPRYPEVTEALLASYGEHQGRVVIDGELAVVDEKGRPSWPLSHKREMQQSKVSYWRQALPAQLFAFDVLEYEGVDLRHQPFTLRRQLLDREALAWPDTLKATVCSGAGEVLWGLVQANALEGLIAKRPDSPYRPSRSSDWVKIKATRTVTCLVNGYDLGEGARASTFGALHLYLFDGTTPVPIGKVGSGFTDRMLKKVMSLLHQPPLIVEVKYLDVSPDRVLRQPVFLRLRTDADITACAIDQLTTKEEA